MKKNPLPFQTTGWFYLLLFLLVVLVAAFENGVFSPFDQWNRDLLYKLLPRHMPAASAIRVKVTHQQLDDFNQLHQLFDNNPEAGVAFLARPTTGLESSVKNYVSRIPRITPIILAAENRATPAPFASGSVKLSLLDYLFRRLPEYPDISWSAATDVIYAPLVATDSGATGLLWRLGDQVYPGFVAQTLRSGFSGADSLELEKSLNWRLKVDDKIWPLGVSAKVFSAGRVPAPMDLRSATEYTRNNPTRLLLIDDGQLTQADPITRQVFRLAQENYLYQGLVVVYTPYLLTLLGLLLCWWSAHFGWPKQTIGYAVFAILVLLSQYIAYSQMQWLTITPVILVVVAGASVFSAYQRQLDKWRQQDARHNELLALAMPVFYRSQQFEKLQPSLSAANPDKLLLDKVFDVALQAEAKNNRALAKKLFLWIEQAGIEHAGCDKKLADYQALESSEKLDQTLVIEPGQTMPTTRVNPAYQVENFGRYQVEGVLGKGAMGIVFQGVDPKINRHVAIKTLHLGDELDDSNFAEIKARFFREAETAGNLSHANIVTIYDVGEEGDLGYIAMDLLTGAPLSEFLKPELLLPAPLVYQLMIQITEALDYAHKANVVHRDIKPANMIYDDVYQRVTLTDFGIACVTDQSKTRTGTIMGSPYYMSPEQVLGNRVDGRSDIFSLGVTFYQLLCGHLPFDGDSIASVAFHIANSKQEAVRNWDSELPSSAVRITNKALQKDAAKRYQNMQEFKQALVNALKRDFKQAPIS